MINRITFKSNFEWNPISNKHTFSRARASPGAAGAALAGPGRGPPEEARAAIMMKQQNDKLVIQIMLMIIIMPKL